ncbi:MAG: putative Ig domain-containing protein, partial [Gammaproteobacteria bacterium]
DAGARLGLPPFLIYKVSWDISDGNNEMLITTVKDDGFLSVLVRTATYGAISARLAADQPYEDRSVWISAIDSRERFVYVQASYLDGRNAFIEKKTIELTESIGEKIFREAPGEVTISPPPVVRPSEDELAATLGFTCEDGNQVVFKTTDDSPACVRSSSVERMIQHGWYVYSDPASIIPDTQTTQAARLASICKEGYQMTFKASDGSTACVSSSSAERMIQHGWYVYSEFKSITTATPQTEIIIEEPNKPPVLAPIGDKTVRENRILTFTATATDLDIPANTLTFSLSGSVPEGASINPTTGVFSWMPTEAHGPGTFTFFDVIVTDDGSPSLSDYETVTVTIVGGWQK